MPRTIEKKKSIIDDTGSWFSKSRKAQWVAIVFAIGILPAWHFSAQYENEVETQQKADEQQKRAISLVAEEKVQEIAAITSLFHFESIGSEKESVALVVSTDDAPAAVRDEISSSTQALLTSKYPAAAFLSDVVLPDFYRKGYFDKAYNGDLGFLDAAQFFQHENALVLVRPHIVFTDADVVSDSRMRSCHIFLTCRAYIGSQKPRREVSLEAAGAGFSDEAALKAAFSALRQDSHADALLAQ